MPRLPKPRWNKNHHCWCANIGECGADGRRSEVYADKTIAKQDQVGAQEWFHRELKKRASTVATNDVTVEWIGEHFLKWCQKQRDDGKLPREEYANRARHLGIFVDHLGPRPARSISADDVTELGADLLKDYAPVYVRNILASARAAYKWAEKADHIEANTILGYSAPTVPRSPIRFAERVEAAAFIGFWRTQADRTTTRGKYDRLTLLLERILIRTGARPKELCRLKWEDIRWAAWKTKTGLTAATAVLPPDRWKAGKKTGKPRTIYLTPGLTGALRGVLKRGPMDAEWVFVKGPGFRGTGANEPWPSGSALSKKTLKVRRRMIARQKAINARIKKGDPVRVGERLFAELPIRDLGNDRLVNYRWRHTAASTLLMLGVDVPTAAELLGTSPEMLYRHYAHILSPHLASAADTLDTKKLTR